MKNVAVILSNLLLASFAIARPSSEARFAERVARRAATRSGGLLNLVEAPAGASNKSHVTYSSNWSGSVIDTPPSGTKWKSVTAKFTVPSPSGSSGSSASAWVGIDGDTCSTAILQTGVDFTVGGGYAAWYEWYPDYAYDFSGISISAGNVIQVTVTASSTKAGTAVIKNISTGKTVTKSLTSTSALCLENAEWIVEDFEQNGALVAFADFKSITFSGAVATTNTGSTEGPSAGTLIDIQQNGAVLTSVSTGSSSLTVTYV